MAKLLTLSKEEILKRALYCIDRLTDNSGRRAVAARAVGVSLRAIESWCEPADPRSVPAASLMKLVIEAHFHELRIGTISKIIDIYDENDDLIGSANSAADASFLADVHRGRVVMRPTKIERFSSSIVMSEEQLLRSRLRKIVASGKIDIRQICGTLGCDEYVLIDMQSEINRHQFGRMPDRTGVEILESYMRSQTEEWAA
ncbi:hypothetical protein HJA87_30575 [Rhizobium bangladeshense]|uniref:XRE family transcriptional regulator n=1 Tax=Rhizobium bangladeshense TaxID=1138189 RepID=A0ABS7LRU8_9HYPH|nr:hypothetical protein [Rhizobium bangladeshense]MBY3594177.1 hypothetical protein [Rhizobium bangladeshense]